MNRRGFSLIELLVVVAIIAVLAGLLLPAVRLVRESAKSATCAGNLRQVGLAINAYIGENGCLPLWLVGASSVPSAWIADDPNCQWGAWWYHSHILGQYLELKTAGVGLDAVRQVVRCPSSTISANYVASLGLNTSIFSGTPWTQVTLRSLSHPLSETVASMDGMERFTDGGHCYGVHDGDADSWSAGSPTSYYNWRKRHNEGANMLYFDGHVAYSHDPQREYETKSSWFTR